MEFSKRGLISPDADVAAPDMNTGPREMAWIVNTYQTLYGQNDPNSTGIVTGKPLEMGGIDGRNEATGLGMFFTIRRVLENKDMLKKAGFSAGIKGKTTIVQGFGNVGSWFVHFWHEAGGKVLGVDEYDCALWNEKGIDIPALTEYKLKTGSIKNFPGAKTLPAETVIYRKCDVFAPSAMERKIHVANVDKIDAKFVLEGANGPVTPKADAVLYKKGITCIPDMLANAGGVTVSYFEWLKNMDHRTIGLMNKTWDRNVNQAILDLVNGAVGTDFIAEGEHLEGASEKQIVYTALDEIMSQATRDISDIMKKENISMRMAAYKYSVENIYKTEKVAGTMF